MAANKAGEMRRSSQCVVSAAKQRRNLGSKPQTRVSECWEGLNLFPNAGGLGQTELSCDISDVL